MKAGVKFDTSKIRQAVRALKPLVDKSQAELMTQAARGFIKKVVDITPPGSDNVTGSSAKKQGENAILRDLAKIMKPVNARTHGGLASAAGVYKSQRNPRNGRVFSFGGKRRIPVDQREYDALKRELLTRVGLLASGWNAAAAKLGVRLPGWVARHGAARGVCLVSSTGTKFRIEITNGVKFVGNVRDIERRIQKALDYQAGATQRMADALLAKAVKKAGF